ncbi:MAG: PaaI family thioesterase [Gammaproteobacteria bacterium]
MSGEVPDIRDLIPPEVIELREGYVKMRFKARPEFRNPGGAMQGGLVTAMLDMGMGYASIDIYTTASMNIEILRPVMADEVVVAARVVRNGRRIVFAEAQMHDDAGTLLARGTQTGVIVEPATRNPLLSGAAP